MSDYDNTNRGVMFPPYPDQLFALKGKVNIDGNEKFIVAIRQRLREGDEPVLVVYEQMAIMYQNDKGDNEKRPDWSGPFSRLAKKIAGWKGAKDGTPFLQLQVQDSDSGSGSQRGGGGGSSKPAKQANPDFEDFHNDPVPF